MVAGGLLKNDCCNWKTGVPQNRSLDFRTGRRAALNGIDDLPLTGDRIFFDTYVYIYKHRYIFNNLKR